MAIGAAIGGAVVSGVLSSKAQKKAASTAAGAETYAAELTIEEQRRQFDKLQELLAPYVQAGEGSLAEQQALIGLSGEEQQRQAIQQIEQSPQLQALTQQGENAILQNAAATGGLRGGNTQAALAQFRPAMLSNLIESQYNKLGGLTQIGQSSAAGVGAAGLQSAGAVGQALQQSGAAQAQSALASGRATADMWGNIGGAIGTAAGQWGGF